MADAKTFTQGGKIKAKDLNSNATRQTTKVQGGKGISVSGQGQEIVINITDTARAPRVGRAYWAPYGGA